MAKESIEPGIKDIRKRPLFLSLLCISAFVYAGFFTILFLIGIINNAWLTQILNDYLIDNEVNKSSMFFVIFIGLLLHIAIFWGTIKIWQLKRSGIYTYIISLFILIAYHYLIGIGNIYMTLFFLLFIIVITLHFRIIKSPT